MTRFRTLFVASLSCTSLLSACRLADDDAEAFRNGVPRQETVEMRVPASGGQALVEANGQALRGAVADTYVVTRGVSVAVNGGGALVLGLVKLVVSHPPTELKMNSAVWGPWKGGPLDPLTYKVTVNKVGEHQFSYTFAGRAKAADSGDFTTFLSGTHTAAVNSAGDPMEGFGNGTFTLDWDARATLPVPGKEVGKATYLYSRLSPTAAVEVDAQFRKVKDDEHPGQLVDVDYLYRATPGAGGSMEFVQIRPMSMLNTGARWSVKSRWSEAGAGRSDIKASGGMLPAGTTVNASECWNTSFASAFLTASWAPGGGWGDEATDCVFKPADYSKL